MPSARQQRGAFTLIEMMITVTLLGFIILGLTAMFIQTQRAFRAGTAQSDVLEAGRAATDLISRELVETAPARLGDLNDPVINFFVAQAATSTNNLPGATFQRINELDYFFALSQYNQLWHGIGYVVAVPGKTILDQPVGTLYRWQYPESGDGTNNPAGLSYQFGTNAVGAAFNGVITTNLVRVADGIVHFRVVPYDTNGVEIASYMGLTNLNIIFKNGGRDILFASNAIPAYLDLELAVLEPDTLAKYKAIPVDAAQKAFFEREQTAGRIHVFRRHIALPNVDTEAYR